MPEECSGGAEGSRGKAPWEREMKANEYVTVPFILQYEDTYVVV